MDSPWEKALVTICQAVQFGTPSALLFAGKPLDADLNPGGANSAVTGRDPAPGEDGGRGPVFAALRHAIYVHCFARRFTGTLPPPSPVYDPDFVPDERLAMQLSEANQSRSGWEPGWEVCRIGADREIQVRNGDRYRNVPAGHYAFTAGPGMLPRIGDHVSLQVLRESFLVQPGMYFAYGETLEDQFDRFDSLRFYFHLDPQGAPELVGCLTTTLNRFQIPFQFKCQKYRENYDRVDAAVLYVARRYSDIVYRLVMECAAGNDRNLRPAVPLFTKRIHPGIGVADDPVGNVSFGEDRCDVIAAALWDVRREGQLDPRAFIEALQRRFTSKGISWLRPYLNPGRVEMFDTSCEPEGAS